MNGHNQTNKSVTPPEISPQTVFLSTTNSFTSRSLSPPPYKSLTILYLHLDYLVSHLLPMSFTFCIFDLQFLNLGFGLLATVFRVPFALCQSLHLYLQLVQLALQGLLGFLHRHLVLQEQHTWRMLLVFFKCLLSIEHFSLSTTLFITLLACSSCSLSSSNAWLCFCLMSAICCSWILASSSRLFFSWVTSVSRLDLERQNEEVN